MCKGKHFKLVFDCKRSLNVEQFWQSLLSCEWSYNTSYSVNSLLKLAFTFMYKSHCILTKNQEGALQVESCTHHTLLTSFWTACFSLYSRRNCLRETLSKTTIYCFETSNSLQMCVLPSAQPTAWSVWFMGLQYLFWKKKRSLPLKSAPQLKSMGKSWWSSVRINSLVWTASLVFWPACQHTVLFIFL